MKVPPRRPAAFRVDPEPSADDTAPRLPRSLDTGNVVVVPDEIDVFAEEEPAPAAAPEPRRSWPARIFLAAGGLLVSLAVGLWLEALVRELFSRAEWLGWAGAGLAILAVAALLAILLREALAIARLASVVRLRNRAEEALAANDAKAARAVASDLTALFASRPETAVGRRAVAGLRDEIIDGADIVRIVESEILAPLDARARVLIFDAAKRVSVVTAVSPRALVDVAYVLFEAGRLIRRLSELYGGRPGTLGFFRLARRVLAHLAVTGAMAAGDELVHQIVGQGLAARLSARLGEGVVNGAMTARIGIAAMDATRPLPFAALRRPTLGDFLTGLAALSRDRGGGAAPTR